MHIHSLPLKRSARLASLAPAIEPSRLCAYASVTNGRPAAVGRLHSRGDREIKNRFKRTPSDTWTVRGRLHSPGRRCRAGSHAGGAPPLNDRRPWNWKDAAQRSRAPQNKATRCRRRCRRRRRRRRCRRRRHLRQRHAAGALCDRSARHARRACRARPPLLQWRRLASDAPSTPAPWRRLLPRTRAAAQAQLDPRAPCRLALCPAGRRPDSLAARRARRRLPRDAAASAHVA